MTLDQSDYCVGPIKPRPRSRAQRFVDSHPGVEFKLRPNGKPTYTYNNKTYRSSQAVSKDYSLDKKLKEKK